MIDLAQWFTNDEKRKYREKGTSYLKICVFDIERK